MDKGKPLVGKHQRRRVRQRRRAHARQSSARRMLTVKLPVALIAVGSPLAAMLATSAPAEAATLPADGPPASAFYLLVPAPAVPPLAAPAYQPGQAMIVGSDAPPEVANPAPQAPQNVGCSLGASF